MALQIFIVLCTVITLSRGLKCNISAFPDWPEDYGKEALDKGLDDYDFVIVGAGSAGSLVAGRLAENINHKILLIEAGGSPPIESEIPELSWSTLFTDIDWQYPTVTGVPCLGFKDGMCVWNKGKVLGGSHSINAMTFLRGNARDYDEWKEVGNLGWGWDDVQHYFQKVEDFQPNDIYGVHGKGGPLSIDSYRSPDIGHSLIIRAAKELGHPEIRDFVGVHNIGFGYYYGTLKDGRRLSTAKAFLTRNLPNLHVIKHAIAKKINFNPEFKADHLDFIYKDTYKMTVRARNEIIISAGSIETPKLLMLSGIGPQAHLDALNISVVANLPVGQNLQDHIRADLFFRYNSLKGEADKLMANFNAWKKHGNCGSPIIDIAGFISVNGDDTFPDIQYHFAPKFNITEASLIYTEKVGESLISQVGRNDTLLGVHVVLLRPKSKGFIQLKSSDYKDQPLIYPNYYAHPKDITTMIRGIYEILKLENTNTYTKLEGSFLRLDLPKCEKYGYTSERYWQCYIRYMSTTLYHPVGSVRMGPRHDITTVVGADLKIHRFQGLRVIDASVMPNLVSANTNAATIMIAEKGVNLIQSEWG